MRRKLTANDVTRIDIRVNINFQNAMERERPLQVVGVINAYAAIQAEKSGFGAVYLSGSGIATASYGLPDLGMTGLSDVLVDVERIKSVCDLPLSG